MARHKAAVSLVWAEAEVYHGSRRDMPSEEIGKTTCSGLEVLQHGWLEST